MRTKYIFFAAETLDLIHAVMTLQCYLNPTSYVYHRLTQFISKELNQHNMNINEAKTTVLCNDEDG